MAYYWRAQDIPELRGLPPLRRRRVWVEAVSRSATPRRIVGLIALVFTAILLAGVVSALFLAAISSLWVIVPVVVVIGFVSDACIRQPAARHWLREHARELDRYAQE